MSDHAAEAFAKIHKMSTEMKEAVFIIEELIHYIDAYNGEFNESSESKKDKILASRWLERNREG